MHLPELKGYAFHGVSFDRLVGNEAVGACFSCQKEGHLYVNILTRLFSCKRCGKAGNFTAFLGIIAKEAEESLGPEELKALAANRGLPLRAFENLGIGWNGAAYTFPVRDFKGKLVDVRQYKLSGKMLSTPGAKVGLYLSETLTKEDWPVYICEGESDTIALRWLLRKNKLNAFVVGVPGAATFKDEWAPEFAGKSVQLLYDNDFAGEQGEAKAYEKLKNIAASVRCIQWLSELPQGWDVRDWVVNGRKQGFKVKKIFRKLFLLTTDRPRSGGGIGSENKDLPKEEEEKTLSLKPISNRQLIQEYKRWLHMKNIDVLKVLFGMAFANRFQGEPLWLFLVAPPGGMKSELIMSFSKSSYVYTLSSLTPRALISGFSSPKGEDASLLPKLDGKILAIKDFTTILTMNPIARDEILGILRDVYDGKIEKSFGTGVTRSYKVRFGIVAGVTSKVESLSQTFQSLGERFLKLRIATDRTKLTEESRIKRALININKETQMREALEEAARRCLARGLPKRLPKVKRWFMRKIVALAQWCAATRGVVDRDRFTQQVQFRPMIEIGTRLAKQFTKLAIGIAIFEGKKLIDDSIYELIKKIAKDTAPDRVELIVRKLWQNCPKKFDTLNTQKVNNTTRLPASTCLRLLQDLELLKVVNRLGTMLKAEWSLHPKIRKFIEESEVYKATNGFEIQGR